MAKQKVTKTFNITAGGTIELFQGDDIEVYFVKGTATLASSLSIQYNGTPVHGEEVHIVYTAAITLAGNNVTIFGAVLTQTQALRDSLIKAYYDIDLAAWEVVVLSDMEELGVVNTSQLADNAVTTPKLATNAVATSNIQDDAVTTPKIINGTITADKLAADSVTTVKIANLAVATGKLSDDAVTTVKLANSAVTAAKIANGTITAGKIGNDELTITQLNADLRAQIVTAPISFEAGSQGYTKIMLAYPCIVNKMSISVTKQIAGTEAATVTLYNHALAVMANGVVSIPLETVVATTFTADPTTNNSFAGGEYINIYAEKPTVGGTAFVTLLLERT
jgi:hypothetical protein